MMMNSFSPAWCSAPDHPQLAAREIHVWGSSLDRDLACLAKFAALLSTPEQERASRFRFDRDAKRFVASRAILRLILSRYLDINPRDLEFSYGPNGKPALQTEAYDLRFSLSHSDEVLLCAVSRDVDLGLDIERIRQPIDADSIAERAFSPAVSARIQSLSGLAKVEAFYSSWVLHEAFVKATGAGLANASIETSRNAFERSSHFSEFHNFLADTQSEHFASDRYQFVVGEDYLSAVVALMEDTSLTHFWWID